MNDEIIVNFTPTGLIPTKEQTEYVPISCNEIVDDVLSAYEQGITTVHLHARHDDGSSAYEADIYGKIIEKIRKYTKDIHLEKILHAVYFNTKYISWAWVQKLNERILSFLTRKGAFRLFHSIAVLVRRIADIAKPSPVFV